SDCRPRAQARGCGPYHEIPPLHSFNSLAHASSVGGAETPKASVCTAGLGEVLRGFETAAACCSCPELPVRSIRTAGRKKIDAGSFRRALLCSLRESFSNGNGITMPMVFLPFVVSVVDAASV